MSNHRPFFGTGESCIFFFDVLFHFFFLYYSIATSDRSISLLVVFLYRFFSSVIFSFNQEKKMHTRMNLQTNDVLLLSLSQFSFYFLSFFFPS